MIYLQTKLADNLNPQTGEPFGEDFLTEGTLNLWGKAFPSNQLVYISD